MMSTVKDAENLVSFAKFPLPNDKRLPGTISGVRGAGSPFAPAVFGQGMGEYIATANKNTFIAVQIETVEGLNNCEEIAKVDGIGMCLVPHASHHPAVIYDSICFTRYAFRGVRLSYLVPWFLRLIL